MRRALEYFVVIGVVLATAAVSKVSLAGEPLPASGKGNQPFIIDYQKHLNKRFKKVSRLSTQFIVIHTSEAGLVSTLRTLSRGKSVGQYRTSGGHANYVIARDGQVYRILHHLYRADHAGLSMWNGVEDVSSHSLGIELVGYHYDTITDQQYRSLSRLLKILQRMYNVPDKNVLTHSQVSYGKPNMWFRRPHRGRKRCALNFEREKAALTDAWQYDPDVRAGRLARDRHIYAMFYKKYESPGPPGPGKEPEKDLVAASQPTTTTTTPTPTTTPAVPSTTAAPATDQNDPNDPNNSNDLSDPTNPEGEQETETLEKLSNVIGKDNTAWNIAGEDYDDAMTVYVLPGDRVIRGDQLGKRIGWNRLPTGTRVLLNQPMDLEKKTGPVFEVTREYTAWSFAGKDYGKTTTIYFLPTGRIKPGNRVSDWDSLPDGTRMIIGYKGPFTIKARQGQTPWGIAGKAYNHIETVYLIPGKGLTTGDRVDDFSSLPRGSKVFLKINN
jgi:N-acetylmuramoyl-L-alanine amidase